MVEPTVTNDRLRRIEIVTDSALANLDPETLLAELLGRIRELLSVDTATVLLVDSSEQLLVATASVGIEEEVRQGVRIPVGRGFAGRVAAERRPVVISHVDDTSVVNPLLWDRGLRSLLGVPLLTQGKLLGVLHVGATTPRRFTDDDIHLLQMVADRIALVAHNQVSVVEQAAAAALQRSLLPSVLPAVKGLEFAARYVPGADTGVGGDWYDVFPLPGDRVGIVMGDVVGHGLPAAVVMGRLRSALRAYALDVEDPAEVLRKLDRKASHFEYGAMATVSYAVVSPERDFMTIASAGHLPPMIASPDGSVVLARFRVGPPIGFSGGEDAGYCGTVLPLAEDSLLCFYTDGLIERRDSTIDAGLEKLWGAVVMGSAEAVCARIMSALVGAETARDDIAILTVRRTPF